MIVVFIGLSERIVKENELFFEVVYVLGKDYVSYYLEVIDILLKLIFYLEIGEIYGV